MADHTFETDDHENWGSEEQKRERFLNWQQVTLQQFSYITNLLLGFSVASIGFEISTYMDHKISLSERQISLYSTSLLWLVVAVGVGVLASIARLVDLRNTTQLARKRWQKPREKHSIDYLSRTNKYLKRCALFLLCGQLVSFGIGIGYVASVYRDLMHN